MDAALYDGPRCWSCGHAWIIGCGCICCFGDNLDDPGGDLNEH